MLEDASGTTDDAEFRFVGRVQVRDVGVDHAQKFFLTDIIFLKGFDQQASFLRECKSGLRLGIRLR